MSIIKKNHKADNQSVLIGLIVAIEAEFTSKIIANNSGDNRSNAAMIARALAILKNEMTGANIADQILAPLGPYCNAGALGDAIRTRRNLDAIDGLHNVLTAYVRAKLAIVNPQFIDQWEAG